MDKIQIARGKSEEKKVLDAGEFFLDLETKKVYLGLGGNKAAILNIKEIVDFGKKPE